MLQPVMSFMCLILDPVTVLTSRLTSLNRDLTDSLIISQLADIVHIPWHYHLFCMPATCYFFNHPTVSGFWKVKHYTNVYIPAIAKLLELIRCKIPQLAASKVAVVYLRHLQFYRGRVCMELLIEFHTPVDEHCTFFSDILFHCPTEVQGVTNVYSSLHPCRVVYLHSVE